VIASSNTLRIRLGMRWWARICIQPRISGTAATKTAFCLFFNAGPLSVEARVNDSAGYFLSSPASHASGVACSATSNNSTMDSSTNAVCTKLTTRRVRDFGLVPIVAAGPALKRRARHYCCLAFLRAAWRLFLVGARPNVPEQTRAALQSDVVREGRDEVTHVARPIQIDYSSKRAQR
jgi:hypothetical protein